MGRHTPTPWVIKKGRFSTDVVTSHVNPKNIAVLAEKKDAIHIVRCVNSHDALAGALVDCIDSLEYVNRMHPEVTGRAVRWDRIREARIALAAAIEEDDANL